MPATKSPSQKLSPALAEELCTYFATHHAVNLSRNLRHLLLNNLEYELRIGVPAYLDELLWQLNDLFDLLDLAQQETAHWHPPPKKERSKE